MEIANTQSDLSNASALGATLKALGVGVVVAPTMILVHEFGHAVPQLVMGYEGIGPLSYAGLGQGIAPSDRPDYAPALISAFGPTATFLLSAVGVALAWFQRLPSLALALVFAATVEPVVDLLFGNLAAAEFSAWARVIGWESGRPAFAAIGLALAFSFLAVSVTLFVRRDLPFVWRRLGAAGTGVLIGSAIWLLMIGPAVLP